MERGRVRRHFPPTPTPTPQATTPDVPSAIAYIETAKGQLDLALAALQGGAPEPEPDEPPYQSAIQDRDPRPKPDLPTLGPAGSWFLDPTFGTTIVRVTDETMGGSSWRVPSNAHIAAWNADNTMFVLVGQTGTHVFTWDATALRATFLTAVTSQVEPCWSRSDPRVLYGIGGRLTRTIQAFRIEGDGTIQVTDLLDLDTLGLGLVEPRTYVGGLVTSDDAIVVFFGGTGQDKHCYCGQLMEGETSFASLLDTRVAALNFLLHSVACDRTGQYVTLYPTNAQPHQVFIWDVWAVKDANESAVVPMTVSSSGHDALGYGWLINTDCFGEQRWDAAQWLLRALNLPDEPEELIEPVLDPKEIYLADHTTWNNARLPGPLLPVISGTYRAGPDDGTPWRAWDDEIIAIATEGPSAVYRFCHHRSDVREESNPAGNYFWYQPIPNVSSDGKWVLFTSNWEKTLGADPNDAGRSRQDVFLVQLPE